MLRKDLLTPAEHQVMLYIWGLCKQNPKFILVRSVLECYPENDRPAYTTLTTFVKILVNKNYLQINKVGTLLTIKPVLSMEAYAKRILKYHMSDFFEDDVVKTTKYILQENSISMEQKERLRSLLK